MHGTLTHKRHGSMVTVLVCALSGWLGSHALALTVSPSGGDDTDRLKCLIESPCTADLEQRCARPGGRPPRDGATPGQCGAIRFGPGEFTISRPIVLKGGRAYLGEGAFLATSGSVIRQTRPDSPIFVVDGTVEDVVIAGLTFTGPGAKAIIASDPRSSLLANAVIRENHFLTDLKDCIAVPLQGTLIASNTFGKHGAQIFERHRHIYSAGLNPALTPSNHNWIVNNLFQSATCATCALEQGVSVGFERGVSLHLIGNRWEGNQAQRTIAIRGMFNAEIKGNYFENNAGEALIRFTNETVGAPDDRQGNYIVRMEDNFYNVALNKFLIDHDGLATTIYMGFEAGTHFQAIEIMPPDAFAQGCYLRFTGPLHLVGYQGTQLSTPPRNGTCPALGFPR